MRLPEDIGIAEYHSRGVITSAEKEVLEMKFNSGMSISQIALALKRSPSSVRSRTSNALRKIGAYKRTPAA